MTTTSAMQFGISDTPDRIRLVIDVPTRLNSRAIDEAVAMAASRLKFLLGQRYRYQIKQRVSARNRVASEALVL